MMNLIQKSAAIISVSILSACQTGQALDSVANNQQVKQQAIATSNAPIPVPAPEQAPAAPSSQTIQPVQGNDTSLAIMSAENAPLAQNPAVQATTPSPSPNQNTISSENTQIASLQQPSASLVNTQSAIQKPRTQKTYLINGLLSAVPFIGYGFRNLHKKMPEAQIHSYISPVESNAVIMPQVLREIEAAYKVDPNVSVNLIGISLGADFITVVAERLNKKNIPVNYLGIVDGTSLRPIPANVRKADNLTCTLLDCTKAKARLARGNNSTIFTEKKFRSSHIPLGNNDELHARVIAQSRS